MKNLKIPFTLFLIALSFAFVMTSCQKESLDEMTEKDTVVQDSPQFRATISSDIPAVTCYNAHIIVDADCSGSGTVGWNDWVDDYTICMQNLQNQIAYYQNLGFCIEVPTPNCIAIQGHCRY